MPSSVVNTTLQAAAMSAVSNVLAQVIKAYKAEIPFKIDLVPIIHFVVFTFLSCPPNVLWQDYLEECFPGYVVSPTGQERLDKANTAKKFLIDQTLGSFVNTSIFIIAMAAFKGKSTTGIYRRWREDLWPITKSGLKLWPMVSLFNFTVVPVHRRVIVGGLVGLFWGIYLSLVVSDDSRR